MDELGLEVTREYQDLYYFDSQKIQCIGVIKDLAVSLFQLPMRGMVMDIVVVGIPPRFGMLLSRSWIIRLGGTLQMDFTYAIVPIFEGKKEDFIENLSYHISLVTAKTPLII